MFKARCADVHEVEERMNHFITLPMMFPCRLDALHVGRMVHAERLRHPEHHRHIALPRARLVAVAKLRPRIIDFRAMVREEDHERALVLEATDDFIDDGVGIEHGRAPRPAAASGMKRANSGG